MILEWWLLFTLDICKFLVLNSLERTAKIAMVSIGLWCCRLRRSARVVSRSVESWPGVPSHFSEGG